MDNSNNASLCHESRRSVPETRNKQPKKIGKQASQQAGLTGSEFKNGCKWLRLALIAEFRSAPSSGKGQLSIDHISMIHRP